MSRTSRVLSCVIVCAATLAACKAKDRTFDGVDEVSAVPTSSSTAPGSASAANGGGPNGDDTGSSGAGNPGPGPQPDDDPSVPVGDDDSTVAPNLTADDDTVDTAECEEGESEACWEGPAGEVFGAVEGELLGNCQRGSRQCVGGTWASCEGAVGPGAADSCEVAADDADCDGNPNEGCSCTEGDERTCGSDIGNCVPGIQYCEGLAWGPCQGEVRAEAEDSCLLPDDDANCDGVVNDGCPCIGEETEACGDCGERVCDPEARTWGPCQGIGPSLDCWETAAGAPLMASMPESAVGNCRFGVKACQADGTYGTCLGAVGPAAQDVCDVAGDDADCNGVENEDCSCLNGESRECGSDVGNCSKGTQSCVNGGWQACQGATGPAAVDSCAVLGDDADCSGTSNDDCQCVGTESESCNDCGVRVCQPASRTWGACASDDNIVGCDPTNSERVRSCSPSGNYLYETCNNGCADGECNECGQGDLRCSQDNSERQTCVNGAWETEQVCPDGCGGGGDYCLAGPGEACSLDQECGSGACVDDLCCAMECPPVDCSSLDGNCQVYPSNVTAGLCNGSGQCRSHQEVCEGLASVAPYGDACVNSEGNPSHCADDGICAEGPVMCGGAGCPVDSFCCYRDPTLNLCMGECDGSSGEWLAVSCDEHSDCPGNDLCCVEPGFNGGGWVYCAAAPLCSTPLCGSGVMATDLSICEAKGSDNCTTVDGVPTDLLSCQ